MKCHLLDVNVLLALVWPHHSHHAVAVEWFAAQGRKSWATCTLTELGFVRLSSNPRFSPSPSTPQAANAMLKQLRTQGTSQFLSELPAGKARDLFNGLAVTHKQVTDLYLAALARAHGVIFVTFDRGIAAIASKAFGERSDILTLSG